MHTLNYKLKQTNTQIKENSGRGIEVGEVEANDFDSKPFDEFVYKIAKYHNKNNNDGDKNRSNSKNNNRDNVEHYIGHYNSSKNNGKSLDCFAIDHKTGKILTKRYN